MLYVFSELGELDLHLQIHTSKTLVWEIFFLFNSMCMSAWDRVPYITIMLGLEIKIMKIMGR